MGSLSSSNNAILFNNCASLQNLTITLQVTQNLITLGNNGFTLQLNCYPQTTPPSIYQGKPLNWFQYVIAVVNNSVEWGIQYWSEVKGYGFSPSPNYVSFGPAASNQVPAGSVLKIALATDHSGNVTSATFSITDPKGKVSSDEFKFPSNVLFGIYGFQVDLVGPPSGTHNCKFTSGAGILAYSVSTGTLTVQNTNTCGGSQPGTGETSNALYSNVRPASGPTVSQNLSVSQAVADSALACYGVNGSDSRVYYLDSNQHVIELGWNTATQPNAWGSNDITSAAGAPSAVSGSALACYGVNGSDSRVYYLDSSHHVIELGWNTAERPNAWGSNDITKAAGAPSAVSGSALACYGVNGADSRIYYLDSNHHVIELGWTNAWGSNDITKAAGAPSAVSGSALACYGVNGSDSRVYHLDSNQHVIELGWTNAWGSNDITKAAGAPSAVGGSALACYGVNGADSRVYCLDSSHHVIELGWTNAWGSNDITKAAGAPSATSGSALACYGVNGADSRVYCLDSSHHVIELGWTNAWDSNDVTKAADAPAAISGSALACFGVNGANTRVYYLNSSNFVMELAWDNVWSTNVL